MADAHVCLRHAGRSAMGISLLRNVSEIALPIERYIRLRVGRELTENYDRSISDGCAESGAFRSDGSPIGSVHVGVKDGVI